jgi:hypothetical protein
MADAPAVHAPAGTVKLPLLGAVSRKTLMIGALVAGGVLAYVYFPKARTSAAAAGGGTTGSAGATVTDPAGNVCAALGPSGYCPGTPEDLAYSEQSGYGTTPAGLDSGIDGQGDGLYYDPADGQYDLSSPYTGTSTTTAITTNAEWEQECIANLQAGGVSQATISAAESGLPRYLAKLTLSSAQGSAVQQAVGLTGTPPQGGPYSIRIASESPPKTGKVKVPDTVGLAYEAGAALVKAAGLKAQQSGPGKIVQQNPAAETEVARGSTVVLFGANK